MNTIELHVLLVSVAPCGPDDPTYGEREFGGDVFSNSDVLIVIPTTKIKLASEYKMENFSK